MERKIVKEDGTTVKRSEEFPCLLPAGGYIKCARFINNRVIVIGMSESEDGAIDYFVFRESDIGKILRTDSLSDPAKYSSVLISEDVKTVKAVPRYTFGRPLTITNDSWKPIEIPENDKLDTIKLDIGSEKEPKYKTPKYTRNYGPCQAYVAETERRKEEIKKLCAKEALTQKDREKSLKTKKVQEVNRDLDLTPGSVEYVVNQYRKKTIQRMEIIRENFPDDPYANEFIDREIGNIIGNQSIEQTTFQLKKFLQARQDLPPCVIGRLSTHLDNLIQNPIDFRKKYQGTDSVHSIIQERTTETYRKNVLMKIRSDVKNILWLEEMRDKFSGDEEIISEINKAIERKFNSTDSTTMYNRIHSMIMFAEKKSKPQDLLARMNAYRTCPLMRNLKYAEKLKGESKINMHPDAVEILGIGMGFASKIAIMNEIINTNRKIKGLKWQNSKKDTIDEYQKKLSQLQERHQLLREIRMAQMESKTSKSDMIYWINKMIRDIESTNNPTPVQTRLLDRMKEKRAALENQSDDLKKPDAGFSYEFENYSIMSDDDISRRLQDIRNVISGAVRNVKSAAQAEYCIVMDEVKTRLNGGTWNCGNMLQEYKLMLDIIRDRIRHEEDSDKKEKLSEEYYYWLRFALQNEYQ